MKLILIFTINIVLFIGRTTQTIGDSPFRIERNEEGIWFYENDEPVLFYQVTHKSREGQFRRANYIHPLYGMGGRVITEDFPADHLHHRGVFWAWHQVRVNGENIGDNWECRDFNWHVAKPKVTCFRCYVDLLTHVTWSSPSLRDVQNIPEPIIQETTRIRIRKKCKTYRVIDFKIRLNALQENVALGGSENDKGYGGFSPRIRIPLDALFIGSNGPIEPQRTAVEAGPWLNIVGKYNEGDVDEGFAMITHPDNPGYPEPWILRRSGSMQNAKYPGRNAIVVGRGDDAWTLQYRLIIHRCGNDADLLNRLTHQFAEGPY